MSNKINPLFDFLNSINSTKKNLVELGQCDIKDYNPYIINKFLSQTADTVHYAQEMNERYNLPKIMQYEFLLQMVRKRKRYVKFPKKEKNEILDLVKEYYDYNDKRAKEVLVILTKDEIEQIKILCNKGGQVK